MTPAPEDAQNDVGHGTGWVGLLSALKVSVEHGINLREGFYA